MVNMLHIPELGKLEIVEVYEYYDQPVLYSCKNAMEHFYLVVAADEDDQYLTWLCAAVSNERLNRIRSGKVDLHDAFAHSESGYVVQVKVPYNEYASVRVDFIQSNQISEDMLPMPGECLDLEIGTLPTLSGAEKIAKSRNQEILKKYHQQILSTFTVIGKLTGVSLRSKEFEIETTEETYKGKITNEAFNTVSTATLSREYTAEIQEITETSEAPDKIAKTKYLLLGLRS
jgi:hypothetical protein